MPVRDCIGTDRIGVAFEQQHAGGDRPILIAREPGDAKHFDGIGDDVGSGLLFVVRRGIDQKGADVAVLDRPSEQFSPLEHLARVEDRAVARGEHTADRLGEPHFVFGERPPRRYVQHVAHPEPPDRQR